MATLLDALELLVKTPPFTAWILGGSPEEAEIVEDLVCIRPRLRRLFLRGCIQVLGRIENSALPEFYSRALVTVIPSEREEFGIVAVEAMMCGCPVVAARTGGLKDLVLDGVCGYFFPPSDAAALARILVSLLRAPDRAIALGVAARHWAREAFSQTVVYESFTQLYEAVPSGRPTLGIDWSGAQQRAHEQGLREHLDDLLQRTDYSTEVVHSSPTLVANVIFTDARYTARQITRTTLQWTPPRPTGLPFPGEREYVRRTLFHAENPATPSVLAHSETDGLVVTEPLDPLAAHGQRLLTLAQPALVRFRAFQPLDGDSPECQRYLTALQRFAELDTSATLEEIDHESADLNRPVIGQTCFVRTHPQVELRRCQTLLRRKAWPLPETFIRAAQVVASQLLEAGPLQIEPPQVSAGALAPQDIQQCAGEVCIADLRGARYAVGPIEEVSLILHDAHASSASTTLRRLSELEASGRFLGCCWFVVLAISNAIAHGERGRLRPLADTAELLHGLSLCWSQTPLTP